MNHKRYKLIVNVPVESADRLRAALGKAGAGKIGNYDFTSFSTRGLGRFRPLKGAHPTIGTVGKLEEVEEEQIETVVLEQDLSTVLTVVRTVHPYEEPVIEVIELVDA
jgi:hypothetical protein